MPHEQDLLRDALLIGVGKLTRHAAPSHLSAICGAAEGMRSMNIKIIRNGKESDWIKMTRKLHHALLENEPDAVLVSIDDLYPNSPDHGNVVRLDFKQFTELVRSFTLEEGAQQKRIKRHHDIRPLEELSTDELYDLRASLDDEIIYREQIALLGKAMRELTPTQRRRLLLYIDGLPLREIAALEGAHFTSIEDSIRTAIKKMKNIF